MPEFKIQRVNYFEGQRLRVKDFEDEQTYHLDMRRRHNKNLHNWGIAAGLKVNREKDTNKITISPGMAIDVDGYEIVLDEPWVVENILTLTSSASGDFILTLAYADEKVSSAADGICSTGLTRVAEKAALFLRAEIGDFIRNGTEVPLAKIVLENCRITGDPDESVREEVSQGKAVKITGDTMTGQLTIDLSAAKGESAQKAHLHLIAPTENANIPAGVSMNRDTIKFWQTDARGQFSQTANLSARGLLVEKSDAENAGDKADYGITLKASTSSKEWQIFQAVVQAGDSSSGGLIIGDVNEGKIRNRLALTPDNKITVGLNADSQMKILGKLEIDLQKQTPELALTVKGVIDAQDYLQNGRPLPQSAWKNVTNGIAYDSGKVGIGTGTEQPKAKLQVLGGAIMPAVGNTEEAGIQFPPDPGTGTGDRAFIRYFVEAGEGTKLLIGCENDAEDRISFQQSGAERLTIHNGKVGIDTISPAEKLHVAGNLRLNNDHAEIYAHDRNHMIVLRGLHNGPAQNSTSYYQFGGTLAEGHGHQFFTGGAVADQVERLRISNDGIYMAGNLGLGTIAPEANFHLRNTRAELRIENTDAGDYAFLSLRGTLADYWDIALKGDSSNLEFRPNGGNANRIIMTKLGEVGIGTSAAPTEKLEVAGSLKVTQDALVARRIVIGKTSAPAAQLHLAATAVGNNDLLLEHTGGSKLKLLNKKAIENEPAASWIGTPEAFALHLFTHDQSRIQIDADGKVGIGKSAEAVPTPLLEVSGEVNATGFTINGNPLPSNQLQNVAAGTGLHLPAGKFEIGTAAIGAELRKNGSLQILGGSNQLPFKIDSMDLRCMEVEYSGAEADLGDRNIELQTFRRVGPDNTVRDKWGLLTDKSDAFGITAKNNNTGAFEETFWLKSSGEVGIGTKAPAAKLHLKGASTGEGFDFLKIEDSAANAASVFLRKKTGAQKDVLTFETRTSDSGQVIHDELLNFDLLNKKIVVGMTGAITDKLDVHGNLKVTNNAVVHGALGIGGAPSATEQLKVTGKLHVTDNATFSGNVGIGTSGGATKNNLSVLGDLNVTGGAQVTGNVGIGAAASADEKLKVTGKLSVTDETALSQLVTIGTGDETAAEGVLLLVHGKIQATGLVLPPSPGGGGEGGPTAALAAERVMSSAEKSFGIGTDAPKAKLHVRGDKRRFDALLINDSMAGSKDFLLQKEARTATLQSSEGSLMTLDLENLNVGIGTAKVPTEKLEVAGNVKIEGEALIMENVTIGTTALPADLEVMGQLFGAAKGLLFAIGMAAMASSATAQTGANRTFVATYSVHARGVEAG
ncbi:hypothetical protein HUU05_14100, partial [candidate division KSB1 bacterium]|nr:hypothetical protein [candidate division KSB1 bacterium]